MNAVYPEESKKIDFIAHLEELRKRILISLAVIVVCSVAVFTKCGLIMSVITSPVREYTGKLVFISPTEAFSAYIKVSILASIVLVFPLIIYEVWAFLGPAFKKDFRKRLMVWLIAAAGLFYIGVIFSYLVAIPAALSFLLTFAVNVAEPAITIGKYISFFCALEITGGIIFILPVCLGLLADAELVSSAFLRTKRPLAVIAIMVFAAIITPTQDIVNMLIFAIPMILLFEAGVLLARCIERRKRSSSSHLITH
ncbi:MAG: twin-arginine translocase subunit TatC [Candidatus Omnitrophica bacterium]|nr:twin-arginine translocase subunit TatC [Candidatus Omnitrophota bacterium]MDD4012883.1 twin-arginine translocase subunit TatC [Candidatus Omnitrophota bacterium]